MNPVVVGVGELLWDLFPDGTRVAGGAPFNFAFHCRNLGHDAAIVSRVGADELGRDLRAEVRRLGLSDGWVQTDPDRPTGTVRVAVGADGQPAYEVAEDVAWDHIAWTPGLDTLGDRAAVVCYGTLGMRSPVSRATIHRLLDESRRGILPSVRVLDVNLRPTGPGPAVVRDAVLAADWVKVNQDEWQPVGDAVGGIRSADMPGWHQKYGAGAESVWIVTRGADGVQVTAPRHGFHEAGVPARVADTVGAGDAFTAAMVCLHQEGRSLEDCARFAVHYASRVCEHRGATPAVDRAEVERAAFGGR